VNADERLRELIHGGPYEPYQWIVMVRLAAVADDQGLVDVPEIALVSDWVCEPVDETEERSDKRALYSLKRLKATGWITPVSDQRWDIGRLLRQGRTQREPDY
jgi:hypothetical protein